MEEARETELRYPAQTASAVIVSSATDAVAVDLWDEERETIIKMIDRGKALERGFDIHLKIKGVVDFGAKMPPKRETTVIKKLIRKKK